MPQYRLYFAVKAVGIAPDGSTSHTAIHGLQSLGIETNFNIEKIMEMGQSAVYENKEEVPDISVTTNKVLDGYCPTYLLATQQASSTSLNGRSDTKCSLSMSVFPTNYNSASGVPIRQVHMSGLYVKNINYTFPVDGNFTEEITLVGNDKIWLTGGAVTFTGNIFTNNDSPAAITGSGGVNRRQHIVYGTLSDTVLPTNIEGISSSGTNDQSNGMYGASIQRISVSTDLGREGLKELGRKADYFKYVNFPVDVTCEVETISKSGDGVNAAAEASNLTDQTIKVKALEGLQLDLGTRNKLTSVTFGGGDTGGGNDTTTYTFTTTELAVAHPADINAALRP